MIKKIVLYSVFMAIGVSHSCEAMFFRGTKMFFRGTNWARFSLSIFGLGTPHVVANHQFRWNNRNIYWIDEGKSIEQNETIDLSECEGPFSVENAVGNIDVREGVPPRLEIQRLLNSESMDDVKTEIVSNKSGTRISTEFKKDIIKGRAVNYTLFLPKTEKVSLLSTMNGSIAAKFYGVLSYARSTNGFIDIDGATSSFSSPMMLKSSNGRIIAKNIKGSVKADTSNGRVELSHINGNATVHTSNGKITVSHINGDADVHTSNGAIIADYIAGNLDAKTSNGKINLSNISGAVRARTSNSNINLTHIIGTVKEAKTSNGKVYRDGKKIDSWNL